MAITEKMKEKLDDASKELRDTVDGLRQQVEHLFDKVKDKFKGAGEERVTFFQDTPMCKSQG